MPDKEGRLTIEEQRAINARFSELEDQHQGDMVCSLCGNIAWSLAEYVTLLPVAGQQGRIPGLYYPTITYYCTNCGHMHSFAASIFGIDVGEFSSTEEGGEDVKHRA